MNRSWLVTGGAVACLLFAGACSVGTDADAPDAQPTPRAEPPVASATATSQPPSAPSPSATATVIPAVETPTPTPSTPEPVPTVSLPEIKSLEYLSADVPVPALPDSFAAPSEDRALLRTVGEALAPFDGEYSVVVRNLEDGRYAELNAGRVFYAASLYKLAVLLEAFRQRDAGEIDFDELLTLTEEYAEYDLNTLEFLELEVGDQLAVADALRAMIIVSDTPTAVMMLDLVGPARVDRTLEEVGVDDMSVTTRDLPTTARDMALLMEAVAAGEGVTGQSREAMLSLLLQESIRGGIPAGVPPNSAVAHKTGNYTDASHDVALVWGPAGPYVLAVLSDRSWESEPLRAVSEAVWEHFAANP